MSQSVGFRNLYLRVYPALLALFALACLSVSCVPTDRFGTPGSALSTGILGQVPDGYQDVSSWDVAGLLRADRLTEVQEDFREQWEWAEQYGIFMDDVSDLVWATDNQNNTLILFAGQFDWDDIIDDLDDAGFRDSTYRDIEMWEDRESNVVVGLLEARNQVVLSTSGSAGVRDTIRTLDRGSGFLFEEGDSDLRRALGKVPEGLHMIVKEGCSSVDVRGCRAVAHSARLEEDKHTLAMEWIFVVSGTTP